MCIEVSTHTKNGECNKALYYLKEILDKDVFNRVISMI